MLLILAVLLTACGAGGSGDAARGDGSEQSRCERASPALLAAIQSGLTVTGGGSLSNAYIVKSDDFENVYFVAARIEGEGMSDTVGVWATNDPAGEGSIFAADAFSEEFSDRGTGGGMARPGFSSADDGFAEVKACAGG